MFKTFDRYLFKEIASPFGLGLLVYTFTLLINQILILSERLVAKDVSALGIFEILLYCLPELLTFTIPMATLMGVLAGLSRMSTDSEIVAFKTMGISNLRIFKPIVIFSIMGFLVTSVMIMYLAPEANYYLSKLRTRIFFSKSISEIKSRTFSSGFQPFTIYFNDMDTKTGEWKNVFLYSKRYSDKDLIILAKRGSFHQQSLEEDSFIMLKEAVVHEFKKLEPEKGHSSSSFIRKKEKIPRINTRYEYDRTERQLTLPNLLKKKREKPKNLRRLNIEFQRKFALPFACLAMGFLALSLGISTKKGGKVSGFIISLGIIFFYYTINMSCESMVRKDIFPAHIGMWLADIFLLIAGIIAFYFSSKEKSINWEKLLLPFEKINAYIGQKKGKENNKKVLFVIKYKKLNFRIFRILDLYIIKKLIATFIFVFFALILVFYVVRFMELLDNAIENKKSILLVLQNAWYYTPEILQFVLPISILTAVLLTFSVLSKNNEIVAVQVSGISLYRLTFPAIMLGLVLSGLFFMVQEDIAPDARRQEIKTMAEIFNRKNRSPEYEEKRRWVVGENNTFYFYDFPDRTRKKYSRFNVVLLDDNFSLKKRILAKQAWWKNEDHLVMEEGFEREFEENRPINFNKFTKKEIHIAGGKGLFSIKIKDYNIMNIKDLREYISYLKKNKASTTKYEAALYNRYAFPLSCLVMVLIAIPFSFKMGKKGTLYGIGFAVGISIIFWGAFGIFSALGTTSILSPFLSAFAPIFIFSAVSFYLFINIKT